MHQAVQTYLICQDYEEDNIHKDILPEVSPLSQSELLAYEKELLGFYLTMHPLEPHRKLLSQLSLTPINEITSIRVGDRLSVAGIVVGVKKITTKAGNHEMAFVKLEDLTGTLEVVVFPKIYIRTIEYWRTDQIITVSGKIDEKDDRLTMLVDDANILVQTLA